MKKCKTFYAFDKIVCDFVAFKIYVAKCLIKSTAYYVGGALQKYD